MCYGGQDGVRDRSNSKDSEAKQWAYRLEQIQQELEMERVKTSSLENEKAELKRQMDQGEARGDKIKRIQAMVNDFREQLDEAQ